MQYILLIESISYLQYYIADVFIRLALKSVKLKE